MKDPDKSLKALSMSWKVTFPLQSVSYNLKMTAKWRSKIKTMMWFICLRLNKEKINWYFWYYNVHWIFWCRVARGLKADKKATNSLKFNPSSILNKLCNVINVNTSIELNGKLNREKERDLRERIDGEFGNGEEFIRRDKTTVVAIELTEALVQRNNLLLRNYTRTREKSKTSK